MRLQKPEKRHGPDTPGLAAELTAILKNKGNDFSQVQKTLLCDRETRGL